METAVERRAIAAGGALLLAGILFNPWFLAIFAVDGSISSETSRGLIHVIEGLLLVLGTGTIVAVRRSHRVGRFGRMFHVVVLDAAALFVASVLVFALCEELFFLFPGGFLNAHPYYSAKSQFEADPELGFRRRPNSVWNLRYRGEFYHPRAGVPADVIAIHAVHDANGHINHNTRSRSDIVIVGDSFVHYGLDAQDTFGARLEAHARRATHNLGTDGYGPEQYLIAFRRYAPSLQPRVALFCFYEGNDIADLRWWREWRETGGASVGQVYIMRANSRNPFVRYGMATIGWLDLMVNVARAVVGTRPPELVGIDLKDKHVRERFYFGSERRPPDVLLGTQEWRDLRLVLERFRASADELHVQPVVLFIPTMEHVYGPLTTDDSGPGWLARREQELAAADNTETAMSALAESIGLRVVSLTGTFKAEANRGVRLFYPFDSHWNSTGREIAARFVADELTKE